MIRRFLNNVFKKRHLSLNTIEISKEALIRNYHTVSRVSSLPIAPVLKSNAYGHGIKEVAKILDPLHPPFFCVDSLYEGYELLKLGITTPILIIGYVNPENLKVKKLPFSYAVYDLPTLKGVVRYQPHAGVHIFVDTGMHREGVPFEELEDFLRGMPSSPHIEGVMSHLAYGGERDHPFTRRQIDKFNEAIELFQGWGINPKWKHIGASSALVIAEKYEGRLGNLGRAGISLYGISDKKNLLVPALCFSTTLVQIKSIKKGDRVGYDFAFVAERDMRIGILPVGYNDGVDMRLFKKGVVSLRRIQCPIIGKVSMNITAIDVSAVPEAIVGDNVVVYSPREAEKNSIRESARLCNTIPYEILVHLHSSTKRVEVA